MTPRELAERAESAAPEQQRDVWFCENGAFWGTPDQLCLCVKCGKNEFKRYDEPRHFQDIMRPSLHLFCDECWDDLPDEYEHPLHRTRRLGKLKRGPNDPDT